MRYALEIKNWKFPRGFTFIELLVSMSIIMLVGSLVLVVFLTSIRGAEKSQRLVTLQQSGNFALNQMVKTTRLAKGFAEGMTCDGTTDLSAVGIISADDLQETNYVCTTGSEGNSIASQSATGAKTQLLDTAAVQTATCSFICGYQQPLSTPYVKIRFRLIPAGSNPQITGTPGLDFSSTVFLRNAEQ